MQVLFHSRMPGLFGIFCAVTLAIVVPIVAACGLTIPKTSSRAITSPAGTADTMETLADCIERDDWAAYSEEIQVLALPAWAA